VRWYSKPRLRIVFNGLTYGLVLSPDTGRVWLDRNLGASQVKACWTNVIDSAVYPSGCSKGTTYICSCATSAYPVTRNSLADDKCCCCWSDGTCQCFNGLTYGLVLSPDTGRVWLDRNLGASQVCTSVTDTACYGDLYQWGRAKDGHESRDSGMRE
jgi:hypothetical protein